MQETTGTVTFLGNKLHLKGSPVKVGDKAPAFKALANDLSERGLADYTGKVVIISVVPSLDTGVCDMQTRRFNQELAKMSDDVVVLTISCDLPFAQARWCGAAGVKAVETLSDHRDLSFGLAYGLVIEELRLLARSVFVLDKKGVVVYKELVPEMTHEVNFDAALAAARALVS